MSGVLTSFQAQSNFSSIPSRFPMSNESPSKSSPKRYDDAFKAEAVRLVREDHLSVREAAEKLGLAQSTLRGWIRRAENAEPAPLENMVAEPTEATTASPAAVEPSEPHGAPSEEKKPDVAAVPGVDPRADAAKLTLDMVERYKELMNGRELAAQGKSGAKGGKLGKRKQRELRDRLVREMTALGIIPEIKKDDVGIPLNIRPYVLNLVCVKGFTAEAAAEMAGTTEERVHRWVLEASPFDYELQSYIRAWMRARFALNVGAIPSKEELLKEYNAHAAACWNARNGAR